MTESASSATIPPPALPMIRLAGKGTLAIGIKVTAAVLALVLQVCLARMLGHAGYGEFAYAFAWLQLASIFAQSGFSAAALRYIAEYRAGGQLDRARGFVTWGARVSLWQSLGLSALMAAAAWMFRDRIGDRTFQNLLIASATLPPLSQSVFYAALIRGFGKLILSTIAPLARPLLFLGGLAAIGWAQRNSLTSADALLLHLAATVCVVVLLFGVQRHFGQDLYRRSPVDCRTGEWLGTATNMMLGSGLMYLQGRTGILVCGLLLDESAAGTYAAMERLADAALLGLASVDQLSAPRFAALHARGRFRELQQYARLSAWGATAFLMAAFVPLIVFGRPVLRLLGDEFVSGYPVLVVLLGGATANALCGSVGVLLRMTGHHVQMLSILAATLIVNLGMNILLVPSFGIVGAACANALCVVLWNLCMLRAVRVRLGIWSNIGRLDSAQII